MIPHDGVYYLHDTENRNFFKELSLESIPDFIDKSTTTWVVGKEVPR